ncbi:MAG: hypothetical protein SFV15_05070 [Polyangiaceae bacterium]|nr:hypothetical protein [Polyangiaceae bacterium]
MHSGDVHGRKRSKVAAEGRRVELEAVLKMTPLERAQLALRLGRRDRAVRELALARDLGARK